MRSMDVSHLIHPLSTRSPDSIPPAFVPYKRPHPSVDDRATSELFRQRDEATRENRNVIVRQRPPRPQREPRQPAGPRIPRRLPQSPCPPRERTASADPEEWDDIAKEDHGNGIPEEDNAGPARAKGDVIKSNAIKEQYRKDIAKGETAVEDGTLIKNTLDDLKDEQHPNTAFADGRNGDRRLESVTTATDSDFGCALESVLTRNPFADPEEHDQTSAPASSPSVTSSWKPSDRIQDYGSPNKDEEDGVKVEARATAKLLTDSAACDCENVLRTESRGFAGTGRSGRGGRYAGLSGGE